MTEVLYNLKAFQRVGYTLARNQFAKESPNVLYTNHNAIA